MPPPLVLDDRRQVLVRDLAALAGTDDALVKVTEHLASSVAASLGSLAAQAGARGRGLDWAEVTTTVSFDPTLAALEVRSRGATFELGAGEDPVRALVDSLARRDAAARERART